MDIHWILMLIVITYIKSSTFINYSGILIIMIDIEFVNPFPSPKIRWEYHGIRLEIGPSMVDVGEHIPPNPPWFGTRKWWYFNIQGFRGKKNMVPWSKRDRQYWGYDEWASGQNHPQSSSAPTRRLTAIKKYIKIPSLSIPGLLSLLSVKNIYIYRNI